MVLSGGTAKLARQVPLFSKPSAGTAMIDVEQLLFANQGVIVRFVTYPQQFSVFLWVTDEQGQPADVVQETGRKGQFRRSASGLRQFFADQSARDAMSPTKVKRSLGPLRTHSPQQAGPCQPSELLCTQDHDRFSNFSDFCTLRTQGRVGSPQYFRGKCRIAADQIPYSADRCFLVVEQFQQLRAHLWQDRQ